MTLRDLAAEIKATRASDKSRLSLLALANFGDVRTEEVAWRQDANLIAIVGIKGDYDTGHVPRLALLHELTYGQGFPFCGRRCSLASMTGMPRAVKPFRTATRIWNLAS